MEMKIRYPVDMPVVQQQIMMTLQDANEALTMTDLIQRIRHNAHSPSPITIRAAVLPLITLQRVEFTPERKLRLKE